MISLDDTLALPGLPQDKSPGKAMVNGSRSALTHGRAQRRHPSPPFVLSKRLTDSVLSRLEDLDAAELALLELVVIGEALGRAEMEILSDPTVARSLEKRGLLSLKQDGRRLGIELAHPFYDGVLRARITKARTRTITRALAEAVEATGARREGDILRVAAWRLIGGGGMRETFLAGALEACRRHEYPLAERLARAAVSAEMGREDDTFFDAALLAARLACRQGRNVQAERELAALASRAVDDDQRGRVVMARLDNSVFWTCTDELGILHEAEASISDPTWRDLLRPARLHLILHNRGPRAAAQETARLLEQDRSQGFPSSFWATRAYSLSRLGQIEAALDAAARGQTIQLMAPAEQSMGPVAAGAPVAVQCVALNYGGRLNEAEELVTSHHAAAVADGSMGAQALFAVVHSSAVDERGHVLTSARRAGEALILSQQLGRPLMVRLSHIYRALALALAGNTGEATDAISAVQDQGLPETLHYEGLFLRARAWTAASGGHLPDARSQLMQAADLADELGDLVGEAVALHGMARLGAAKPICKRLAAVSRKIEGTLAPTRLAHSEALASHDTARLEHVSRDFEAMGAYVLAAEAAADASVARQRSGEPRQADAAERRAHMLAERCEGVRTPALLAINVRGCLTPAEWEVAFMAAYGHTSKQIAEEVHLAVRTIENRLQRTYDKLGVSSRAELADALGIMECPATCPRAS